MRRFIIILLLGACPALAGDPEDPVLDAMRLELDRSWKAMTDAGSAPVYYLGYQLWDSQSYSATGSLGALRHDSHERRRRGWVDVRVGSPKLDNSHQIKGSGSGFEFMSGGGRGEFSLPQAADADALRAKWWLATEEAFRKAQTDFAKVQANYKVTASEEDPSDDFSAAPVVTHYKTSPKFSADREAVQARVRKLSAYFKPFPFILSSQVSIKVSTGSSRHVNSEGSSVASGSSTVHLAYSITSRTDDGMDLDRYRDWTVTEMDELPSDAEIESFMKESVRELKELLAAPLMQPYQGPAIFGPRATGVYFHEILGHRLEGHRQKLEHEGQTFKKKIGKKVTAPFISVYDDPTMSEFNGMPLAGTYAYDDEMVEARRVTLVAKGLLKGFLMSRSPIENFPKSNGHGRRGGGAPVVARMGVTVVEASRHVPEKQLRAKLVDLVKKQKKEYGLWFTDIQGGFTTTGRGGTQAFKVIPKVVYKVFADGRPDEMVRGADIVGTPLTSFLKIVEAGDRRAVFNGVCGAESGWVPVSAVAPSVLISEIEVEKSEKASDQPPLLPPPHHDSAGGRR